jgi:S-adenosylmethionine:tRNA ribosyltransferase-isomerase
VIAATAPVQRPPDARLLVVTADGSIRHSRRRTLVDLLRPGDLVVANDAATLPASLQGLHARTGRPIEVRLAARRSLSPLDVASFTAIVFGEGDYHTPTEHRPAPPPLAPRDVLRLGPLHARIDRLLDHPRLVALCFEGTPDDIWSGIARHGRPIQYAHMTAALEMWDIWTPIAGPPVAFEPPSAGFALDWRTLAGLQARGVEFVTLTHAAGISSTGDDALDARLPFDEPYEIPVATALGIRHARGEGRRIVAIGTTVVRALEHAATIEGDVPAGPGLATQRIGADTRLRVVDAIVSGVHEPATSHYQLLRAFAPDDILRRADEQMTALGYRTHEFGDSVLIERASLTSRDKQPHEAQRPQNHPYGGSRCQPMAAYSRR